MTERARLWIGTSWKMNKTLAEARAFAEGLIADAPDADPRIRRFVIPPFTAVREVKAMLAETAVQVGAQNMHWDDAGAWTGEVSAPMLRDCGLDLVELGHSERRAHFGETDDTVGRKVAAAVRHGLTPLVCIGETRDAARYRPGRYRAGRPGDRGPRPAGRTRADRGDPVSPTSRSGRSARVARRPPPTMPKPGTPESRTSPRACWGGRRPASMAAASTRTTARSWSPVAMSTACSSAAPLGRSRAISTS